jgi:hypothetical protein
MAIDLFGFTIGRKEEIEKLKSDNLKSFVPPQDNDGALEIAPGGVYGTYVDLEGTAKSEAELVTRYREMSTQPEADLAIDDIVNEAIVYNEKDPAVSIVLDDLKVSQSIKNRIRNEFDKVLRLLHFTTNAYEVFRRWYIDGRLYYHIVIDESNPRDGIQELRQVDPRKIRKVKQPVKSKDDKMNAIITKGYIEYYIYHPRGINRSNQGLKISKDSVIFCHTGLLDNRMAMVLGHLHKAIKPLNQLRMLEDATVIYRLARAPERRIFYIDVGNLPKMKAEQYLRDMMVKHKNKLVYDAQTGEVRDDRKFMTMLEDFWLPRREGGRSTEITTLPGGQNLGEMEDVEYFKKKLYKALNVPISRMEPESNFNLGRASEITRDELKFTKFVARLRNRFTQLFDNILETQLILTGVTSRKEWHEMREHIHYDFLEDNHFSELKYSEIMGDRLRLLGEVDSYVGKYFSKQYVRSHVLRMTEDEIADEDKQMDVEEREEPDEDMPNDQQAPEQEQEPEQQESFQAANTISEEEKTLVNKMTKIMETHLEDDKVVEDER